MMDILCSRFSSVLLMLTFAVMANAHEIIEVSPCEGDATRLLQDAIDRAAGCDGKPVTIKLKPGDYNISRTESSRHKYHISNTASAGENPDQTKHIGLWFRGLRNVTFDGDGAWIVTHGEMTPLVIDSCCDITLKNFTLTAADPSVPEIRILDVTDRRVTFEVIEPSRFEVHDGNFHFEGEGWIMADGGRLTALPELAQVFYPERNVTLRCESPLKGYKKAVRLDDRTVMMEYDTPPGVHVGEYYQLRHGIRNEACGFFNLSKDVTLQNIEFNFMGNFGLVGQYSENITYRNIRCRPRPGSGRTDAGFADFVQMSGCRGKILICDSYFEGAHDDPINIHGTHLKATSHNTPDRLTVKFMHGQTYGFTPFYEGDSIEIVDRHTLNTLSGACIKGVRRIDDYSFDLTLDRPMPELPASYSIEDIAVENVTWTPEVEIVNNYFARTPTRGILITTRGHSLIQDNIFFRIPMPSILVSDDARGWYESGAVHDLTIRRNLFIECGSPVIDINPEIGRFNKPVHRNIVIENNRFILDKGTAISVKAADNVAVEGNVICIKGKTDTSDVSLLMKKHVSGLRVGDNRIETIP